MSVAVKVESELTEIETHFRRLVEENRADELVGEALKALGTVIERNNELERSLANLKRQQFKPKSEKVSAKQMALFIKKLKEGDKECAAFMDLTDDPFLGEVEEALHCDDDAEIDETRPDTKPPKKKRGRRKLPASLPRTEVVHKVARDKCTCKQCGRERKLLKYEVSEELEFTPATLRVKVHKREVLSCACKEGIETAPGPQRVFEGGQPGPNLLATVMVDKYRYGLPLYRQSHRFEKLGYAIPCSTLGNWVKLTSEMLNPIVAQLQKNALAGNILATDGTGLDVLDKLNDRHRKRGALYCHIGQQDEVFFLFSPNQKGGPPVDLLRGFKGHLIKDAAPIYDVLVKRPPGGGSPDIIECGCWMHCRRYFFKAFDAGDSRAAVALKHIKRLYKIEELAKRQRAGPKRLTRVRRQKSDPIVRALWAWIAGAYETEPPDTPLGKALGYAIRHADSLEVFLGDARIPIDNGDVERTIRTVAVTRKNYLFAGSDEGGYRAAVMYSIIASCERIGVDPVEYIADVLTKLAAGWKAKRLHELLPQAWKTARA